jgi:hypothetical protein
MKTKNLFSLSLAGMFMLTTVLSPAQTSEPKVSKSVFFGKSKPLCEMKIVLPGVHPQKHSFPKNPFPTEISDFDTIDPSEIKLDMQKKQGTIKGKGPVLNFEGVSNVNSVAPGDPNGDVGPNHYVQSVNASFAVWDKNGNILYGPADYQSLWDAIPGPWNNVSGWWDPVFKYDQLADRWLISAMSLDFNENIFHEMVAVSVTPDPLGEYYCYAFEFDEVNDYPKVSVWPDGYYINYNMHTPTWQYLHSLVTVLDREAMLAGEPEITMIEFEVPDTLNSLFRYCPLSADLRGSSLPDDLTNFVVLAEYKYGGTIEFKIDIFEFLTNWETPENSTFELVTQFDFGTIANFFQGLNAPQPGNFHDVETWIFRLMYPLTYRKFEEYEAMVVCHTMWDGSLHYLKWYEFRKEEADWYIYQTGNYSPDNESRYMPSISINGNGDIAMGYTKSSLELYPSIFFTGRRAEDPPGEMTFQEIELYKGLNYVNNYYSNAGRNRWGDYSSMMVDPVDDSTFWYTSMYPINNTNWGNWSTRVVALNLEEDLNAVSVYAGPDTTICGYEIFITNGQALNFNYIEWMTSGDGSFTTNNMPVVKYLRGTDDLENGEVMLSVYANGYEPGSEAVDSMMLYLNKVPEAYAGPNDTIYSNESYTMQGEVAFSNDIFWTTAGDGTFNDTTLLNAIYTPGSQDILNGEVELTLNANPLYPCTQGDEDEMDLTIIEFTAVNQTNVALKLNVSPNPSKGIVNITGICSNEEDITLQVINSTGKIIFNGIFKTKGNRLERKLDVSFLKDGIYYVRLTSGPSATTIKLIKY